MSDSLATVTAYWRTDDARTAQRALDSAGIEAVVEEKSVAKVRVENVDALRAGDVLNASCDDLGEVGEADEERTSACPECGLETAVRSKRGALFMAAAVALIGVGAAIGRSDAAFFGILASALFVFIANRWRCTECGATWN